MNNPAVSTAPAKCAAGASQLLIVDIQENLGRAMPQKVLNRVVSNTELLTKSAALLEVPVLLTEQYPRGLGATVPAVAAALPEGVRSFDKTCFSACGAEGFGAALEANGRQQVVVVGMEAHVCVLQTAIDLAIQGLQPIVIEDAVCSRRLENYQNGLDRLRRYGITVASAESVIFEWLVDARHPSFKEISALLR